MTRTITITKSTHERLEALRRDNESFSDLLTRLAEKDPMAFAGSCPGLAAQVQATSSLNDDL